MNHCRWTFAIALALGLLVAKPGTAQDRPIRFIKVADTGTLVPPEPPEIAETFSLFVLPSIDQGNVAFAARNASGVVGMYAWIDGALIEIADQGTVLPNSTRLMRDFGLFPSIDDDTVTFRAASRARPEGIYVGDGTTIEVVADSFTLAPNTMGHTFGNFGPIPTRDDGTTTFIAFTFGEQVLSQGVYKAAPDGTIKRVADLSTQMPDGELTFGCPTPFCGGPLAFESVFTSQGNVLFSGLGGTGSRTEDGGLFTEIDYELSRVLPSGATIPGTSFPIGSIGIGSNQRGVISGRDLAFVANSSAVVARIDGVFETIASSTDLRPGGGGQFERFSGLAIDNANVAFANRRSVIPTDGIFLKLTSEESVIKIINADDLLDGKEIEFFGLGPEAINGHEIAFTVGFKDGSQGIYIASFGNQAPIADAGEDRFAQCTDPDGASVALDGSGSSDPEGDPLTYIWRNSFGEARGVRPQVRLPFGPHPITLVVDDGQTQSAPAMVIITVVDTTPPGLVASLTPVGASDDDDDDDEGRFRIGFAASDTCDPVPTVTAVLDLPGIAPIHVVDGQVIEFEREREETEVEYEDGILEIEAASLVLRVDARDANSNASTAEISLTIQDTNHDDDALASANVGD